METKYLKRFNETGVCELRHDNIIEDWNKKWYISQWGDEYTLIKVKNKKYYALKVQISEIDAKYLIEKLNLLVEESSIFRSGKTWK